MKKVLLINGNPQKEEASFSRRVAKHYVEQLKLNDSEIDLKVFNVYDEDVPLIDGDVLEAWGSLRAGNDFSSLNSDAQKKVARMGEILQGFKDADEYIFVSPLWNFSITPKLKAYIDNVLIAGETFKYTESGPVGLLDDKKATIVQASGGFYSEGPMVTMEHGSNYIKQILAFMGITDVEKVLVEGVAMPDKSPEERINDALVSIESIFSEKAN